MTIFWGIRPATIFPRSASPVKPGESAVSVNRSYLYQYMYGGEKGQDGPLNTMKKLETRVDQGRATSISVATISPRIACSVPKHDEDRATILIDGKMVAKAEVGDVTTLPSSQVIAPDKGAVNALLVLSCVAFGAASFLFGYDDKVISPIVALQQYVSRATGQSKSGMHLTESLNRSSNSRASIRLPERMH